MSCPFCDIAEDILHGRRLPLSRWDRYDASGAYAITPLNPVTDGHVLIIPFEHVASALVRPRLTGFVMDCAAEYAAEYANECNIITSAGKSATQTVRHLHVHIVPRREGDGLLLPWSNQ